jgi:hypothetical protein
VGVKTVLRVARDPFATSPRSVGLAAALVGVSRRRQPTDAQVFLPMPAFSQKHWLAELLRNIESARGGLRDA